MGTLEVSMRRIGMGIALTIGLGLGSALAPIDRPAHPADAGVGAAGSVTGAGIRPARHEALETAGIRWRRAADHGAPGLRV